MDRRGFLKKCGLIPLVGGLAIVAKSEVIGDNLTEFIEDNTNRYSDDYIVSEEEYQEVMSYLRAREKSIRYGRFAAQGTLKTPFADNLDNAIWERAFYKNKETTRIVMMRDFCFGLLKESLKFAWPNALREYKKLFHFTAYKGYLPIRMFHGIKCLVGSYEMKHRFYLYG